MRGLAFAIGTGAGLGYAPFASGTWGSLLTLPLAALVWVGGGSIGVALAALVVVWEFGESLRKPWSRNYGSPLLAATLGALAVALPFVALRELEPGTGQAVAIAIGVLYGGATLVCLPALWRRNLLV